MNLGYVGYPSLSALFGSRCSPFCNSRNLPGFSTCTASPPRNRVLFRMVATSKKESEVETKTYSPRAAELLGYLRAHKSIFSPGVGFKAAHLALFRKNDTGKSMLPAEEIVTNAAVLPGAEVARVMLECRDQHLDLAKERVLTAIPNMADDKIVLDVFWHDLGYFYRVISYAAAVGCPNFLHKENMTMLKDLYVEIGIPNDAVSIALNSLKGSVIANLHDEALKSITGACFDVVSDFLTA